MANIHLPLLDIIGKYTRLFVASQCSNSWGHVAVACQAAAQNAKEANRRPKGAMVMIGS